MAALESPTGARALVERHRLLPLLDDVAGVKVVLVTAPAGYGKTILLRAWQRRLQLRDAATTWLAPSAQDDAPERIVPLIRSAVVRAAEHGGFAPEGRQSRGLALLPKPVCVFVDGFEVISSAAADGGVRDLIATLPRGVTLVIASRRQPAIGAGELRVSGELREVMVDDLRFDRDEVRALLREQHQLSPGEAALDRLCERTEGWPAAVRLVGLALEGKSDAESVVDASSAANPRIAQYLGDTVLAHLPSETREFLLRTCLPSRLCGELCDALTGRNDGARMLDRLERSGLFLTATGCRPGWYRYHALFAELLRRELERDGPEPGLEQHRAAARWLARHDHFLEAVDHAFAAGDHALAADLLDEEAMASVRRGDNAAVVAWTSRFPAPVLDAHPRIGLAAAWAHACQRDTASARARLAILERARGRRALGRGVEEGLSSLKAVIAFADDRTAEVTDLALEKLHDPSGDGTFEHGCLCNVAALGLLAMSRFAEAPHVLVEARASHRRDGSSFGEAYSIAIHGLCAYAQGRPREALDIYRGIDELPIAAEGRARTHAVVATPIADVLYELDRLDEAEAALAASLPLPEDLGWFDARGSHHLTLARLHAARGRVDMALRVLESGELEAMVRRFTRLAVMLRWEAVRLLLRAGRLEEAQTQARQIESEPYREPPDVYFPISEAEARDVARLRLAIRSGCGRPLLPTLADQAAFAMRQGRRWRWLKLTVLRAQALQATGEARQALRTLREAMRFGAQRGFIRSIGDEGPTLVPLLEELGADRADGAEDDGEIPLAYVERVLAVARASTASTDLVTELPAAPLAEPLSARERDLLVLLAAGLSNRGIAKRMCVSENTVKTHARHIYAKFQVASRTAALAFARKRGLLG